ncbi:hypothetical protein Tco_0138744 [Tanacetum coccineum]
MARRRQEHKATLGPHDTQYCMENLEQAFVDYASSSTDEVGHVRLFKFEADFKQQLGEMTNKIDTILKAITDRITGALPSDTVKNPNLNVNSTTPILSTHSYPTDDPSAQPIMRRKLNPKEDINRGVNKFTGRIKEMHVFIGNFTYFIDFMIVEDIGSIIDPRLSQVVLGKPFVEISNMTHDPPKGVVRFTNGTNEIAYKMPHKIEQYNSLLNLEKEHTKSVYLRNEENKRRGVNGGGLILYQAYGNLYAMIGKKNGRMMLESIENGPLVYPTVEVDGQIRKKKYTELTEQEQLQDDCDVQVTNIVLQGLQPDVYALINHCQSAKDIWERVKLLMKGTELSYQEHECKLYNEFDKFTSVK